MFGLRTNHLATLKNRPLAAEASERNFFRHARSLPKRGSDIKQKLKLFSGAVIRHE
jgi:hypothetical protein